MVMIPHPAWMMVLGVLDTLVAAYFGAWLACRRPLSER
jgi:hypothetical protein